ncbi:MAG: threonine dehydrogenase-like Zn-dependent dehydrogenase [Acidimicrobiales bacterium]|jgi:threonine dehydrogenase-like Zn-dependent dehydrogenase
MDCAILIADDEGRPARCQQMQGVVFQGNRQIDLLDFPDPTPGPDDVVLEIKASGMCGSDLHFYRAPDGARSLGIIGDGSPTIGGHEPCGVVVARGLNVADGVAPLGARVMNHHYSGCGACEHCRVGWQQLCAEGFRVYGATAHGGHAKYLMAPADTMVPLPDALSFSAGAAISCGTGTAFNALVRMGLTGRDTLAVYGQGPVGTSAVLFARHLGARVIAVDLSPERLAIAQSFGAEELINSSEVDPVAAIAELTEGRGAHMTLDCTGAPEARAQAVRSTRVWGTTCLVGEGGNVELEVSKDILRKQLTIMGSWTFSSIGQAQCANYVAERGIDVDQLFTHRFRLEQAVEAYELFDQQTSGKGVFEFA